MDNNLERYCIYFFLIALFGLTASCSSDELIHTPVINPEKLIEKKIHLTDFINEIKYVPLSNEIIFQDIVSIEFTDNLLFIYLANEGLFVYDIEGNLKRSIGKRGKGPGEYIFGYRFTLNRKNEKVFILDKDRILKYTFNGDFLGHISFSKFKEQNFNWIIFSNGRLYLYEGVNLGYGKYDWIVLDTVGNVLYKKLNSIEQFSSAHYCSGSKQETFNNNLFYWNQINDTIFKINEKGYTSAFLFAQGNFRFPKNPVRAITTEYFYPRKILFTKDYMFFSFNYQFQNCTGIYIISEQQLYVASKTNDLSLPLGPGFNNNFDGGLPFVPLSFYTNDANEEFLVGEINPFELKAHVDSEDFKTSTPKFPEKKKALERLAKSLNDNDNPVLMIVKLKT
jgi:hypothetical protein